jgi:prophage regulatory protein
MINRFLRLPEVKAATGKSRSTLYNGIAAGRFPPPIHLGVRMRGWLESEIAAMNAALTRGASDEEIRALVVKIESDRKKAA